MSKDVEMMDTSESVPSSSNGSLVAPPPAVLSPVSSFPGPSSPPQLPQPISGPCPTEIAFSFDTTGSMSSCLEELQANLKTIITRLLMDIPALKIAIMAHGDYCDAEHFYVTKSVDFTNDVNVLFDFVTNCGGTGGGDYEECYELVLKKVREELSWTPGTTKSLVMIGDAIPHPAGHGGNNDNLDWRAEVDRLHGELGARVYAVQCMVEFNKEAIPFWQELSKRSFGKYLEMNQFATVIDLMMAICYREGGNPDLFEAYEREVRAREGAMIGRELDMMFNTLRDGPKAAGSGPPVAMVRPLIAKGVAAKSKAPVAARPKTAPTPKPHAAVRKYGAKARSPQEKKRLPSKRKSTAVKQRLLNRESVPENNFILNSLNWCPWKLYRHQDIKNNKLFAANKHTPAVYEIAVQPCERSKRYVVSFEVTSGIPSGINWDTYLLRKQYCKDQLDLVLKQSCKVFVRRAAIPKVLKYGGQKYTNAREISSLLRQKYQYAWRPTKQSNGSTEGRDIVRRGHQIAKQLA